MEDRVFGIQFEQFFDIYLLIMYIMRIVEKRGYEHRNIRPVLKQLLFFGCFIGKVEIIYRQRIAEVQFVIQPVCQIPPCGVGRK